LDRLEFEFFTTESSIIKIAGGNQNNRMAIRFSAGRNTSSDNARCTTAVLNDNFLFQVFLNFFSNCAR